MGKMLADVNMLGMLISPKDMVNPLDAHCFVLGHWSVVCLAVPPPNCSNPMTNVIKLSPLAVMSKILSYSIRNSSISFYRVGIVA